MVRFYLLITLLETGLAAYMQLARLRDPAGLKPIFLITNRIALFLFGSVFLGLLIGLIFEFRRSSLSVKFNQTLDKKTFLWGITTFFTLVALESGQNLLFLGADLRNDFYPFFLSENTLVFQWALIVSGQSLIGLGIHLFRRWKENGFQKFWSYFSFGALIIGIVLVLVFTGTGFYPRSSKIAEQIGYFVTVNAPLPLAQVAIAWILFTACWMGAKAVRKKFSAQKWIGTVQKIVPLILLWILAFTLWAGVPVQPNYHLDTPRAPNFQYNVASDSFYYEVQAHRLLVGEKFLEDVQHPLYGYFISGLHLIGGEHYQEIYRLQIAFLALIPFLFYKLTSSMHSRYAGWLMGIFFILRERNSLLLGDTITVSNAQMLMTETVSLLGVVLAVYLMVGWLSDPERSRGQPFLIGSLIGLLALIRIELLSVVFVFGLVLLLKYWKQWGKWLRTSLVMGSAVMILVLPWMSRNWLETGSFSLEKRNFVQNTIRSYANQLFGQEQEAPPIGDQAVEEINDDIPRGFEKIWLHAKNSASGSLLYLPSNHQPLGGVDSYLEINPDNRVVRLNGPVMFSKEFLRGYVKSAPYWDLAWDGSLAAYSIVPISISLSLALLGLMVIWRRNKLIALTPVLTLLFYVGIYALFGRSGGRFVKVVDWVSMLYFTIGLSALTTQAWNSLQGGIKNGFLIDTQSGVIAGDSAAAIHWRRIQAGFLIVVGLSMPAVERLIPPRYTEQALESKLIELGNSAALEELDGMSLESDQIVVYGKALYPGFFEADEDLLDDRAGRVPDVGQSRVMFYLVGMENIWVSLPMDEGPEYFPHGSEVIITGKFARNSAEDLANNLHPYLLSSSVMIVNSPSGEIILQSTCRSGPCQ